jgi:glycosyltransferase involved in cell wall biosynthesis
MHSAGTQSARGVAYGALIRTFNSEGTLPATLASVRAQSLPPASWVVVDSGSQDGTLQFLPPNATLHRFEGREFNYSAALNQGVARVREEFVLVISSHTALANPLAVEYGLGLLLGTPTIGAVYFDSTDAGELRHELITSESFDGFNGVWNTCAMHRTALLRERPFRPDVFSAEDQEWSAWWLNEQRGSIARVSGAGQRCANLRHDSPAKRLNEYVSVAWFSHRRLLRWDNILRQLWLGLQPGRKGRVYGRRFYLRLAARLVACRVRPPLYASRYY